jgi:outer membrane cobalamin receptor
MIHWREVFDMRRNLQVLMGSLLGLGVAATQAAATQPTAAQDDLEEVTVFGALEATLPQELARYGNEVSTISQTTLRNGGYVDVAQALERQTPGLYLSPASGPFSYTDISLQGSRRSDVLWVVDGMRINNRLYNTTSPNDTIPSAMIERIEVLKDGQGLYYGTQAVAGVINVVTRGFSDTPDGRIMLGGGTNENVDASGYYRGALGDNKFVAFASYDRAQGYKTYDILQPSAIDRHRGYEMLSLGGKYGYQFSNDLAFSASWQHNQGDVDDLARAWGWTSAVNHRNEEIGTARLDYKASDRAEFTFKAYIHDWDSHYSAISNDGTPPYTPVVEDDHDFWGYLDYGASVLAKFSLADSFDTYVGYDYQNYHGRDEVLLIDSLTEHVHGVFTQLRTTDQFSRRAHFAAGLRYNRGGEDQGTTVWNASGRFDLTQNLFIEGVVGTAFRLPDAYELYAIDPFDTRGNPDLRGEKSHNYNLSIGGNVPEVAALDWRVTGFWRKVDNLIDIVDDGSDNGVWGNTDEAVKTRGIEGQLASRLSQTLSGSVGYTWARVRAAGSDVQLQRIPRSFMKASLDYQGLDQRFGAGASFYYLGDRFQNVSGFGVRNSGGYGVLDLNAHLDLSGNGKQRVNLRLENVLDRDYVTGLSRAFVDVTGTAYVAGRLGVPRTLHLSYSMDF